MFAVKHFYLKDFVADHKKTFETFSFFQFAKTSWFLLLKPLTINTMVTDNDILTKPYTKMQDYIKLAVILQLLKIYCKADEEKS